MFPLLPARHLSSRFILLHLINMIGLEYTAGGGILMSPHRDHSVAGMILSEESAYESETISGKTDNDRHEHHSRRDGQEPKRSISNPAYPPRSHRSRDRMQVQRELRLHRSP